LFFNFAKKCLVALNYRNIKANSLVSVLKAARLEAQRLAAQSGKPSPFARG
jgi:hypothetical protein